ncbi:DJ-1/PfpI family protein [Brevibacillus sp. GCM10020057]|uniref:DJ-1/PfpI family protein n=1 Tax=Brevibacillus sp. GCM10020057 TaxID=3317327 RepID=UPI00363EAAF4
MFARVAVYVLSFVLIVGGIAAAGFFGSQNGYWFAVRKQPVPALDGLHVPEHQPNKQTVAVVLGSPTTEVFDFMVPYEMFAMTGAYNVYAVAPSKQVTSLTGGLDLVPHYSFEELDRKLGGSPDLIVVPFMPMVDEEKYRPVREWLQKHAETEILSICAGSTNVADAGLLKGKFSSVHWQVFEQAKKSYPDTNWIPDRRYVQDGKYVASAGLTSGIDAVLYVISQKLGEPMAEKIAQELHYPTYRFVKNPKVAPYRIDRTEAVYYMNLAFQWNKTQTGVLLYDGMDDGELISIFDTYSASGTTNVHTISDAVRPVETKYHLYVIPRFSIENAPKLDRLFVTGTEAKALAAREVALWKEKGTGVQPEYTHEDPNGFMFDAPLTDLAKQEDMLTANYGLKRLEYRPDHLAFKGAPFSFESFGNLLLTIVAALLVAFVIDRRFILKRAGRNRVRSV